MEAATKNRLTRVFFVIILIAISFAIIQDQLKVFKEKPLHGSYEEHTDLKFNINKWWTGEFQQKKEAYIEQHFGLHNFFVRCHHQMMYSLFNHASANQVIVGKQSYLYEENYLKAVNGDNFIGSDSIINQVVKLKNIQDSLKSKGVELVVVLAPGKGSYYAEFNPTTHSNEGGLTNYKVFSKILVESGVHLLDFNKWFLEMKDTVSYPLIPKTGIHWSKYGEYLAADSLIHYLEKLENNDYADMILDKLVVSDSVYNEDKDIEMGMNLICEIPNTTMAYPQFHVSDSQIKPDVLLISDSFYWGMFGWGMSSRVFNNSEFWYYYNQVYPKSFETETNVADLNVREKLEQQDVVVIMCNEANLNNFSFGFIENVYDLYNNAELVAAARQLARKQRIQFYIDIIKISPDWLNDIKNKIKGSDKSLDQAIFEDAVFMFNKENNMK